MMYLKTNSTMAMKNYHFEEHAPQGWEWINHSYCWAQRVLKDEDNFAIIAIENKNMKNTKECWLNGFTFNDKHYSYWCAPAGMTRQQTSLFMRDDVAERRMEQLNFGLTLERVNTKVNGKYICSGSRYTNYQGLTLTSGVEAPFDIDRAICIRDVEWNVRFKAIHVDAEAGTCDDEAAWYEDKFDINDGSACCLPGTFEEPSHSFRLGAWWKGLMTEFDWLAYDKMPETLTDCWGKEHNLKDENINVIFTDSTFKLWKAWDSWDQFKADYKKYDGQYMVCVLPCDHHEQAHVAYEALQSLPLSIFPKDEIERMIAPDINVIYRMMTDANFAARECKLNTFGCVDLVNSPYYLNKIREEIQVRIDKVAIGKVKTPSEFYFIAPDWCAVFGGRENAVVPEGYFAITNGWNDECVDIIRYPHMFTSGHVVRKTMTHPLLASPGCVYYCANSPDPKILEADFDSDKILMFKESNPITQAAKRADVPITHYSQGGSGEKHAVVFDFSEFGVYHELERSYGDEANVGLWSNYTTNILNSGWPQEKKDKYCRILSAKIQNCIDTVKSGEVCHVNPDVLKEIKKLKKPHFMKTVKHNEFKAQQAERKQIAKRKEEEFKPGKFNCAAKPNGGTVMGQIELMAGKINFNARTFMFEEAGKIEVEAPTKEMQTKIQKVSNKLSGRWKPVESKLKCNTYNMWNPSAEAVERAKAILAENDVSFEDLLANVFNTTKGSGIAALLTVYRQEFIDWLHEGKYEVVMKHTQSQKGVRVITEDDDVFLFDSVSECAEAFDMNRPLISRYLRDGKLHKVKFLDEKCTFEIG